MDRPHVEPGRGLQPRLGWIIVGGESGTGARPFTSITTRPAGECAFRFALVKNCKGGDPAEWPEDIRVREMPEVNS